jgi:hypothetical protein
MRIEKELILALQHINQECINDLIGGYPFSWSNRLDYITCEKGFRISLSGIEKHYDIMPPCLVDLCKLAICYGCYKLRLLKYEPQDDYLGIYDVNY